MKVELRCFFSIPGLHGQEPCLVGGEDVAALVSNYDPLPAAGMLGRRQASRREDRRLGQGLKPLQNFPHFFFSK